MDIFRVNKDTCTQCGACAAVYAWGLIDFKEKSYPRPFPLTEQACRHCAACMFGGPGRRTLFILTADGFMPDETRAKMSGRVEYVKVDIPGAGLP
jgi:heterodisulfide reductase subunit A-like polyferredoxin